MEGINNIKKKLLITIFTFLFLIRFIYSQYPTEISSQNNAVSSLESNSIIQWIITSSTNGYSTVAQYLANFISIKGIPSYVWTIITFLIATLFFIAIYIYLFEIFTQRTGISESETMKKAKILLIFALSVFSAIAIGFAIPFLFNLYGFILLILLLVALFFFGRATISYGRSFHYAAKSFSANVEKDLLAVEKELKEARGTLSKQEANQIGEGIKEVHSIYNEAENVRKAADEKFQDILSKLIKTYEEFVNNLINGYKSFLKNNKNSLNDDQSNILNNSIKNLKNNIDNSKLQNILNSQHPDIQQIQSIIQSIIQLHNDILNEIRGLGLNYRQKQKLQNILKDTYENTLKQYEQTLSEIKEAINEYGKVIEKLNTLYSYEHTLNDIELRVRKFLHAHGNRKPEIGMLYALNELKNDIRRLENSVYERIQFLKNLGNLLENLPH